MTDPTDDHAKKYLKIFRDNPENGHFRFALFKETKAYRDFFNANREKLLRLCDSMTDDEDRMGVVKSFLYKIRELFDINAEFFLNEKFLSAHRIITILDPSTDIEHLKDLGLSDHVWPWLMHTPGIVPVQMDPDDKTVWSEEPRRDPRRLNDLKDYEKLFKVDYRKSKKTLIHEFDVILSHIEKTTAFINTSRLRKEGWRHLRVWRLRRQRIGFPEIAKKLGITEEDAKNSFYRAYELIEGRPYDQEQYKLGHWNLRQCKTCSDNPDRGGTCKELCPDMLEWTSRGHVRPTRRIFDPFADKKTHEKWIADEAHDLQSEGDDEEQ